MSYTCTSILQRSAAVAQVREIIDLLGYTQVSDGLKVDTLVSGITVGNAHSEFSFGKPVGKSLAGLRLTIESGHHLVLKQAAFERAIE